MKALGQNRDDSAQLLPSLPEADRPQYREASFNDVDHFGEAIALRGLQVTQLSRGTFQGHLAAWALSPSLTVTRQQASQSLQVTSDQRPHCLRFVVLLSSPSTPAFARDRPLVANAIFGFDVERPVHLITSSAGQDQCQINVSKELFQHYAALAHRYDLDEAFLQCNMVVPALDQFSPLRAYLLQLFQSSADQTWCSAPQFATLLEQDLMPLLIDALPPLHQADTPQSYRRAELVTAAKAYIMDHLDQPLTLAQICQAVCTSQRSLQYGFQEMLGMGPMAFVKVQRLHGIRRALLNADPKPETVAHIAHQWGFFSLGHFSRDYKKLFGELPSQTLKRR
ncbi:helix-turn-helix domain-containing protein [Nodosilinea sp. P-1105]|uniref:helix-turn-helix domain-containing protein n=1 Tax=Nodosilinea sp. P-1105 TaxID=2546229 RepID=UPI00146DBE36|nr:helix-turn-helix domain-containing protein [Nodosilinea sp. P-1105]NMF84511.1 helix-turn-helix domain-containing protein [Nodosilinea sp. P-1105]